MTLGGGTLTTGYNNSSTTYAGIISGSGGLTKAGTGTFTLTGSNSFSGAMAIENGTLITASLANSGANSPLGSGSQIIFGSSGNTGELSYTGASAATINRAITLTGGGGRILLSAADLTLGGAIGGSGALTKTGAGVLVLTGSNNFTGATTVSTGILRLAGGAAVGDSSAVTLANASGTILDLNGSSETIGSLAGGGASGGNVTLGGGTLTAGYNNSSTTYAGIISGSGGLTKAGTGTCTLTGSNSFSGAMVIENGTLITASLANSGASSPLGSGSQITMGATSSTGELSYTGASAATINRAIVLNGAGGRILLSAADLTLGGSISGSGGLTKSGTSSLVLSGSNNWSGPTTLAGGTLRLAGGAAVGDSSAVTLATASGAILDLSGSSETIGSLAGGGSVTLGAGTLTSGGDNSTTIYSGVISGSGGFVKTGGGMLTLSGINLFTGPATVAAGTLRVAGGAALANNVALSLTHTLGARLDLNGSNETIGSLAGGGASGGNVTLGSGTLTTGGDNSTTTFAGSISGSGGLTKAGTGTFTISGNNSFIGATTVTGGTLRIAGGSAISANSAVVLSTGTTFDLNGTNEDIGSLAGNGALTLGAGTLTLGGDNTSTSFQGSISGSGGLIKTGSGTLSLSGNSYTGPTSVSGGILRLLGGGVLSDTASVTLANAAGVTLDLNGYAETMGSLTGGGASGGNVALGGGILILGGDNSSTTFAGAITGAGSLTKNGTGIFNLAGLNTYSGPTTISAGTLLLTGLGTLPDATAVVLANSTGVTLDLNGASETIGSLAGGGLNGGAVLLGAGSLTTGGNNSTTIFPGSISGSGGLTKTGTGTLTLSGSNTYSGPTSVAGGTLRLTSGSALADTMVVTLANAAGAALEVSGNDETIGSLAGGGASGGGLILSAATLTTGGNNATTTFAGVISGGGGFTKTGSGTLYLSGVNTYSGNLRVAAGAVSTAAVGNSYTDNPLGRGSIMELGSATTSGRLIYTGAADGSTNRSFTLYAGGGIFENSGSGSLTLTGSCNGNGGLTKTGAGLLVLQGSGYYSGNTVIEQGLLRVAGGDAISNTSTLTIGSNPGTGLDLAADEATGALAGGGSVFLNAFTLTFGANNLSTTYGGAIQGAGSIRKAGSGTTTLTGTNTYSGTTYIDGGTLRAGGAGAFGSGPLRLLSSNLATFDLNGYNTTVTWLDGEANSSIALGGANLTVTDNVFTIWSYAGSITGVGGLVKQGNHTMYLSGTNSYSGMTLIEAGQIRCTTSHALPATSAVVLTNTYSAGLRAMADLEIGSLSGGGTAGGNVILDSGIKLTTGGDNSSTTYAGGISGTGSWLTKAGSGTLTLAGFNTYTGPTNVTNGVLRLRGGHALSDASNLNISDAAGVALELDGSPETIGWLSGGGTSGGNVLLGSSTLTIKTPSGSGTTYNGAISGSGGLTINGPGSLTLGGTNIYTGTTTLSGAWCSIASAQGLPAGSPVVLGNVAATTLNIGTIGEVAMASLAGGGPSGGNLQLNANHLRVGGNGASTSFGGVISGAGSLTKTGTGSLDLSGVNTWTGTTTIEHGQLRVSGGSAIHDSSAVVLADAADAALVLYSSETLGSLSGGGVTGGNVVLVASSLTVAGEAATPYAGSISGTGGLTYTGTLIDSQLVLTGQHSYSGSTFINNGNLILTGNGGLPAATSVVFGSFGALSLQTASAQVASLSGGAFSSVNLGSGSLYIGADNSSSEFLGSLSGSGNLTKYGSASLKLDAARLASTGLLSLAGGATSLLLPDADIVFAGNVSLADAAGVQLTLQPVNNGQAYGSLTIGRLSGGGGSGGVISIPTNLWLAVGSDNSSSTFAGNLTGGGNLRKLGSGTLTLSGNSELSGSLEIIAGRLNVLGGNALADTTSVRLQDATLGLLDDETIGALTGNGATDIGSHTLSVGGGNASSIFSGSISGSGGLTKIGTGTFTLANLAGYTGSTTILGGIFVSQGVLPDTGRVVLADAAGVTLRLAGSSDTIGSLTGGGVLGGNVDLESGFQLRVGADNVSTSYGGRILGSAGQLAKTGSGTLTLTGTNSYGGMTSIEAGTLRLAGQGTLAAGTTVSLANVAGATLDLNGCNLSITQLIGGGPIGGNILLGDGNLSVTSIMATTTSYAGSISGTGGLTKDGGHTLELTGSNTYTGLTSVRGGTLRLAGPNTLSDTGRVVLANNSTLELAGDETIGSLRADSSSPLLDLQGHILTLGGDNSSITYAGRLWGAGTLVKQGSGVLTLSTASSGFAATLNIQQGTVATAVNDALFFCPVVLGDAAGVSFDLGNHDQRISSLSGNGGSVILGTARLTVGGADSGSFGGTLYGSGGLTKDGTGTLTLTGTNTYAGMTLIKRGTLKIQGGQALPALSDIEFNSDFTYGATLDLAGSTATVGSLSRIDGYATVALGGGNLVIGGSNNWLSFDGVIAGPGNVTKVGNNWLDLSGASSFEGTLAITQGSVRVGQIANMGVAQALGAGSQLVLGSAGGPGTLSYMSRSKAEATDRAIWLNAGGGVISLENIGCEITFSGAISGPGALTLTGASNSIHLSGANNYTGPTRILAGSVSVSGGQAIPDSSEVTLGNSALLRVAGSEVIGSIVAPSSAIVVVETGATLTLESPVTNYACAVFIDGSLAVGGNGVSSNFAGTVTVNGGTLRKTGSGTLVISGNATASLGSTVALDGGTLRLDGPNALPTFGTVRLANTVGATLDLNDLTRSIYRLEGGGANGGDIHLGTGTLILNSDATDTYTYGGAISGSGGLVKDGSHTLVLSGANTYTGMTTLTRGHLKIAAGGSLPATTSVFCDVATVLELEAGTVTLGSISGDILSELKLGSAQLVTGGDNMSTSLFGTISGAGSLTKVGSGGLWLAHSNTFTGPVTVNGGTLIVQQQFNQDINALPDGSRVTLANAAGVTLNIRADETIGSLAGGGTIGGTVFIGKDGALRAGADNSTTTFAGTFSGTGNFFKQGSGMLTLTGTSDLSGMIGIQDGTLRLMGGTALDDGLIVWLYGTSVLEMTSNETLGGLSIGGRVELGSTTLTVGGNDKSSSYSGVIAGTGGLTKIGGGTFSLAGTNTYTGPTTITGGTLDCQAGAIPEASAVVLADTPGTTLRINSTAVTIGSLAGGGDLGGHVELANNGLLRVGTDNRSTTYDGVIYGLYGQLIKTGAGTLTLTRQQIYTGATTIEAGTLRLARLATLPYTQMVILADVAGATLDINGLDCSFGRLEGGGPNGGDVHLGSGTLTLDSGTPSTFTYGGSISGAGGFTKDGAHTLVFSGNNTYAGQTLVRAGTLRLTGGNSLPDLGRVVVTNLATLELGADETIGSLAAISSNPIVLLQGHSLTLGGDNTSTTYAGRLWGPGALVKQGTGILTIASDTPGFAATVSIQQGTLVTTVNDAFYHCPVELSATATFDLGNVTQSIGSLAGGGINGGKVVLGTARLTVRNAGATTFSGIIEGTGGLTMAGAGTFTLTGNSSFEGPTSVQTGSLILGSTGSITTSSLTTVAAAATLGGSGSTGDVRVTGTLRPGMPDAIGSLTTKALDLASGSNLLLNISSTATAPANNRIMTHGDITISASAFLELQETGPNDKLAAGTKLTLIDYSGHNWNGGTFGGLPNHASLSLGCNTFVIQYDDLSNGSQSGKFVTLTAASDPYVEWATAHGIGGADKFDDSDGDGVSNIVEFALAGDPSNPAARGPQWLYTRDASNQPGLILTLLVRSNAPDFTGSPAPASECDGIRYRIQGSLDLADNFQAMVQPTTLQASGLPMPPPTGYVYRSFRLAGAAGHGFLRVAVEALP